MRFGGPARGLFFMLSRAPGHSPLSYPFFCHQQRPIAFKTLHHSSPTHHPHTIPHPLLNRALHNAPSLTPTFTLLRPLRTHARQIHSSGPVLNQYNTTWTNRIEAKSLMRPNATRARSLAPSATSVHQIARRFKNLDFSRYYFFPRRRKMKYLLTRRGLIRPGKKHNYRYMIGWRRLRFMFRHMRHSQWPRLLKQLFYLIFYYYLFLYLLPYFLRWQYDITPRSLTRFDLLDFEENWEHKIMGQLRQYRHNLKYLQQPGNPDPNVQLAGSTTPCGKPFREGLIYYYIMFIIYPFTSGMLDFIMYPRMFFFGLEPFIPKEFADPRAPMNPLITMSTRDLLKFLSIIQTRMYLAQNADLFVDKEVNSRYIVYDSGNNLYQYQLRCKRYKKNLEVMDKTYKQIVHEIFRRIHSGVFYSGREGITPAPKYIHPLTKYELNELDIIQSFGVKSNFSLNTNHLDDNFELEEDISTIKNCVPGLYEALQQDIKTTAFQRSYQQLQQSKDTIPPLRYVQFVYNAVSTSIFGREAGKLVLECRNLVYTIFDRFTWLGYRTGLEHIIGLDTTLTGRDVAVTDYRLHDFKRANYPLFMTTIKHKWHHFNQLMYSFFTQFSSTILLSRDILDLFQFPIFKLNSDIDEIVHYLVQPELNEHYITMLRSLHEVSHSHDDGSSYDFRRLNHGVLLDRHFKLKQNILMLEYIIAAIQNDLDIAKASTIADGETLSTKQFGCEWTLHDLKLQQREMKRISRDIDYILQSDLASAVDPNIEPIRGDIGLIARALNKIPMRLGATPKNILRRVGWIERGSVPLNVINQERLSKYYQRDLSWYEKARQTVVEWK